MDFHLVGLVLFLVYLHNLKTVVPVYPVGNVHCIPVSETGRIFQRAVMVIAACAVNNFIFSVIVDVSNGKVMVSLSLVSAAVIIGIVSPVGENHITDTVSVRVLHTVSRKGCSRIVATAHYRKGMLTVKICRCRKESVNTVSVTVAPLGYCLTSGYISHILSCLCSVLQIEDREVLGTVKDITAAVSVIILCTDCFCRQAGGRTFTHISHLV